MKLSLITPRVNFTTEINELMSFWTNNTESAPYRNIWNGSSIGLITLAALTPDTWDIEYVDENLTPIDFNGTYDLVAISSMTQQSSRAYEIADLFRSRGITTVMGGVHASLLPEEVKLHADSVVIGEAENLWKLVLSDFANNTLKPFYKSDVPCNLEDSPIPRYDLLKTNLQKVITMQTTRGCPHDCEYCTASKIFGFKYRSKSVPQIVKEIEYIKRYHSDFLLFFADDNLFANRSFTEELLDSLKQQKIRWNAQSDISIGKDHKLLQSIKESGCNFLFIGLESIAQSSLSDIDSNNWKQKQLKNYKEYIRNIQSNGIGVIGAFIIGLDNDEKTIFSQIEKFIEETSLHAASFTILTPFPKTRLRERFEMDHRITTSKWELYTGFNVTYTPKGMTKDEIEKGLVDLFKNVYNKKSHQKRLLDLKNNYKNMLAKNN